MRFPSLLLLMAAALATGCEQSSQVQTTNRPVVEPATQTAPAVEPAGKPVTSTPDQAPVTQPDNTAVNARDDSVNAKTPIDQNENETDIKITADIRKRVLEQPDFSVNARNVKIITADGKVTLRGPVATEAERDSILKIAQAVAGDSKVDSQLQVAP